MTKPNVGIVMGSDSDLPIMKEAATMLEELGVAYELTIASAHRTPARLSNYAKEAEGRGLEVIIAGAGGAAHLPGVIAALTPGCHRCHQRRQKCWHPRGANYRGKITRDSQ